MSVRFSACMCVQAEDGWGGLPTCGRGGFGGTRRGKIRKIEEGTLARPGRVWQAATVSNLAEIAKQFSYVKDCDKYSEVLQRHYGR